MLFVFKLKKFSAGNLSTVLDAGKWNLTFVDEKKKINTDFIS